MFILDIGNSMYCNTIYLQAYGNSVQLQDQMTCTKTFSLHGRYKMRNRFDYLCCLLGPVKYHKRAETVGYFRAVRVRYNLNLDFL